MLIVFFMRYRHRPLHAFGGMGLWLATPGLLMLAWLCRALLLGHDVGGRPLLITGVMLLLMGLQLIVAGLVGEMLIRIYHEGRGQPQFTRTSTTHWPTQPLRPAHLTPRWHEPRPQGPAARAAGSGPLAGRGGAGGSFEVVAAAATGAAVVASGGLALALASNIVSALRWRGAGAVAGAAMPAGLRCAGTSRPWA